MKIVYQDALYKNDGEQKHQVVYICVKYSQREQLAWIHFDIGARYSFETIFLTPPNQYEVFMQEVFVTDFDCDDKFLQWQKTPYCAIAEAVHSMDVFREHIAEYFRPATEEEIEESYS